MKQRYINLALILVLLAAVIWADLPSNPGIKIGSFERTMKTILGLDLRGGVQVLLEAAVDASVPVDAQSLEDARNIIENRSNGLGVSEVTFQVAGNRRIVGEFPGLGNPDEVISVLQNTGQLEFVDLGDTQIPEGTIIKTDSGTTQTSGAIPAATPTPDAAADATAAQPTEDPTQKVWHTVMTGTDLSQVSVGTDELGNYVVNFELKPEGKKVFADYTTANVGKFLAIVLDKKVVSAPRVNTPITEGSGQISGNYTNDSANNLAIQLRYGALPIPLKVVETRLIGPTLGQDSLNKSMLAGLIGFAIVALFMILFYRLPGAVAVISITIYALITLALYKLIPVTLTLPGIAGFLLSTGGALDANILMFERLKEELHSGRTLRDAVERGWTRAWSSIRDSNIATLITSAILFWFGSNYGASMVKGFALTLALGVLISLFAAYFITRTLLSFTVDMVNAEAHEKWFGA